MELIAVVWFFCGWAAGTISSRKGNGTFKGILLGLLFGPIGVLVTLVMPANQRAVEAAALKSGNKRCPYCAELIRVEAKVCKHCQKEQPAGVTQGTRVTGDFRQGGTTSQ